MKTPAVFIWMYADSDVFFVEEGQKGEENDLLKHNNYFFFSDV